jgi:hypothetical protein
MSADGAIFYAIKRGGNTIYKWEDFGATESSEVYEYSFYNLMCDSAGKPISASGGDGMGYDEGPIYRILASGISPIVLSPEALDPGEIVSLEYLTNSTDLLPTLSPYN